MCFQCLYDYLRVGEGDRVAFGMRMETKLSTRPELCEERENKSQRGRKRKKEKVRVARGEEKRREREP
jgi:hypothetical protein